MWERTLAELSRGTKQSLDEYWYNDKTHEDVFCHNVYKVLLYTCAGESISSVSW